MGNREVAFVAATPWFTFHSDFWLNLHDYLYGLAGGGPTDSKLAEEGQDCLGKLPANQVAAWDGAVAFYREKMAERHHRRDPLMRAIRYSLTDLAEDYDPDPELANVLNLLRGAAPAYRTCLWQAHDARNRARIGELTTLLVQYAPELTLKLAQAYREPWPGNIPVDIVSYSDYAGANTASGRSSPSHTTMSSIEPDTEGIKGLELLLHEATHLMFGANHGTISRYLDSVSDSLGVKAPRDLWHAISFHTSGLAIQGLAEKIGIPGYEPYAKRTGLYNRAWPAYVQPIEDYWQPYLEGNADLRTALSGVVSAISKGER